MVYHLFVTKNGLFFIYKGKTALKKGIFYNFNKVWLVS